MHHPVRDGNAAHHARLTTSVCGESQDDWTPLHVAAQKGDLQEARHLLATAAPVDAADNVRTALLRTAVFSTPKQCCCCQDGIPCSAAGLL
jgi:hypothetical protein